MADYEDVSRALTAALAGREVGSAAFDELLAAETKARDLVVLTRYRLIKGWRAAYSPAAPADLRCPGVLGAPFRD